MSHHCLNCATSYDGNFCPQCGQKSSTHRITFKAILHDIPHSVFHIDKGVFHTFRQLLYKPGKLIRNYIDGKRVNYFSPFAYLFLLCSVSAFITHSAVHYMHITAHAGDEMLFPSLAAFFYHYPALMLCLLVPFISFCSWIFNLDTGYNYWENLVLNTYLMAQFNLFFILNGLLRLMGWYSSPSVTPMLLFFMGYITLAYIQFFRRGVSVGRIIRNVIMFFCIALVLITGLSVTGFMTPWWHYTPREVVENKIAH